MYLTRLRLDPRSAQVRRDLSDPYEMHRTLVRPFVRDAEQSPPRILWRIEPVAALSDPVMLVQAQEPANWSVLENYLRADAETREFSPESLLRTGQSYRFRLFANPTVTRDGKRQGVLGEAAQQAWLARQGQRHGFVVESLLVTGSELLRGRKGGGQISLLKVCFEGRLKVNNVAALAQAVRTGIGPGKAFGCGLLSLGRA